MTGLGGALDWISLWHPVESRSFIHYLQCIKTITINVSQPVYAEFRAASRAMGRPTSELIREAMELYRRERLKPRRDLTGFMPRSAGPVLQDLANDTDLLADMLDGPV